MALEDEIAEGRIQTNKTISDYTKLIRVLEAKFDAANEHSLFIPNMFAIFFVYCFIFVMRFFAFMLCFIAVY